MPAMTESEYQHRADLILAMQRTQPVDNLIAAGCCPSLTIVDYGRPTQHVVYCERPVDKDGRHIEPWMLLDPEPWETPYDFGPYHVGLCGVDVPDMGTGYWQWPTGAPP